MLRNEFTLSFGITLCVGIGVFAFTDIILMCCIIFQLKVRLLTESCQLQAFHGKIEMEIYFKRGNLLDRVPFSYLKRCKNIKIKEEENN